MTMKYFRFAFMSIYDNIKVNILMVAEILVILLGVNIIVGSYNNRNMLIEPYSQILKKTGWYMANDKNIVNDEPLLDHFQGDLKQIRIESYLDNMGNIPIRIKIVPDEIIDNMKLSVQSGKWQTNSEKDIVCISAPNIYGITVGDTIKTATIKGIKVTAILTDPCYIPDYSSWSSNGGIENFYSKYSTVYYDNSVDNNELILIMSQSEFAETGLKVNSFNFKFILYDENPTIESTAHNEQVIKDNYSIGVPLSSIKYRAELDIKNLLKKYIPIAASAFIVILIGIISCTAINTLRQTKNYGTLFICGMRWSDCIKICAAYTTIIMICSVSLAIAAASVCKIFNISAYFGLTFQWNNVIISILILTVMLLLNLIIPAFIIRHKTPVEIIKENN